MQVSTDGGKTWTEVSAAIASGAGIASGTYVGRIVASGASRGTAYVVVRPASLGRLRAVHRAHDRLRQDLEADHGGLPGDASVRSIHEYPGKPNVVFAGTERHLFVARDSGAHWTQLAANLPTTRYDDILVHPRTKDLILATHGRSIWILDDASVLAEFTPTDRAEEDRISSRCRARR